MALNQIPSLGGAEHLLPGADLLGAKHLTGGTQPGVGSGIAVCLRHTCSLQAKMTALADTWRIWEARL